MRSTLARSACPSACNAGGVLGIDGQDLGAGSPRRGHEQLAGRHQAFLVGQRDAAPLTHGGERRRQAGSADDRRNDAVGRARRPPRSAPRARRQPRCPCRRARRRGPCRALDRRSRPARRRCCLAAAASWSALLLRGQRHDPEPVAIAADQIERAGADRAGGAEHADTLRRAGPDTWPCCLPQAGEPATMAVVSMTC